MPPEQTTPIPLTETTPIQTVYINSTPQAETIPTQAEQTTTKPHAAITGAQKLYDPRSTLEQFYSPKEVHWVDISEITSFSIQNIMGTILMNVGTLVIGLTTQVNTGEVGAVQLQLIIGILGIILFIVGIGFFGASYLITLRQLKQKKKPLPT